MEAISLAGLNKADVLAALYNASKPQGAGFLSYNPKPMTRDEAAKLLEHTTYFDYLQGRVMKVDLSKDELSPWGFDRDNGQGAAARAIEALRRTKDVNPAEVAAAHRNATLNAAQQLEDMPQDTSIEEGKGVATIHLGLGDLKAPIDEAVKKVRKELGE